MLTELSKMKGIYNLNLDLKLNSLQITMNIQRENFYLKRNLNLGSIPVQLRIFLYKYSTKIMFLDSAYSIIMMFHETISHMRNIF